VKKIKLSAAFILIFCLAFPVMAIEEIISATPASGIQSSGPTVAQQPPASVMPMEETKFATSASGIQPTVTADDITQTNAPQSQALGKARLTFMDSKLFDAKLSKELESGKDSVEIEVTGRVSLNNIPLRMDRWVVKSAEEGKVELLPSEPAPKTRFIFSLFSMVFSAFGSLKNMQEERMYDQATKYDTKIFYKKDESGEMLIEKIVMIKRKPRLQ